MRCDVCNNGKAELWFNILNVCKKCHEHLLKRKIELEHIKEEANKSLQEDK